MRFTRLIGIAAATLVATIASASAQQGVQVGVLDCQGGQSVGFVVGSATEFQCVFHSNVGAPDEPYIASVHRYGLDIGVTQQTGFAWAVNAPTTQIGPGALSGHFGGVGVNATVGLGVGANLLVGGSANAYSLQPLSVQGQTGLSAVAGIVDVELRPAETGYRGRRHYRGHYHHPRHYHHKH